MPTLYSYTIDTDAGSAPNPFWGICTLAICKPAIRRTAKIGDWVVGLGSKKSGLDDPSSKVVYAMQVTKIMSMEEYDRNTRMGPLKDKIPVWGSRNPQRRLGDSIYEFTSNGSVAMRESVHYWSRRDEHRQRDLAGKFVLLSDHYYYFGNKAVQLPQTLFNIRHPTQGHKSTANDPYFKAFVDWIEGLGLKPNTLIGGPIFDQFETFECSTKLKSHENRDNSCRPCSGGDRKKPDKITRVKDTGC